MGPCEMPLIEFIVADEARRVWAPLELEISSAPYVPANINPLILMSLVPDDLENSSPPFCNNTNSNQS